MHQIFECDEWRTCLYRCVEDFKVVLLVVVESELVACGGRKWRRNGLGSACCDGTALFSSTGGGDWAARMTKEIMVMIRQLLVAEAGGRSG